MTSATPHSNGHRVMARGGLVIALLSAKGSPGATTAAVGLAAQWPESGAAVIEVDPSGGDLASRFGLHPDPGLASAALESRRDARDLEPRRWTQRLPCVVDAVLAPPGTAAAASLSELAGRGPELLRAITNHYPAVMVDAGRWQPHSAADPLLGLADVVLLVARPAVDEIRQVQDRLPHLRSLSSDVHLLLVGDGPWSAGEVGAALGVTVAGELPSDRRGAGVLSGRLVPRGGWSSAGWHRLPLLRALSDLAGQLHAPRAAGGPTSKALSRAQLATWARTGSGVKAVGS